MHAIRVAATHPKLSRAIRVAATNPSNHGMRVAATHPGNEQCSEGSSDTPCTVSDEATSGAHPHPGVNKLRWGGGPPGLLRRGKSSRCAPKIHPKYCLHIILYNYGRPGMKRCTSLVLRCLWQPTDPEPSGGQKAEF